MSICKYVKFTAVVGMVFCGLLLPCLVVPPILWTADRVI